MYLGLKAVHVLILSYFSETLIFSTEFPKNSQIIKIHENPFGGSRFDTRGRTERQTDMTNLKFAFRNYAKNSVFDFSRALCYSALVG